MAVNICQNLLNYTVKICTFLLYVNYISIFRKKIPKSLLKIAKYNFLSCCTYVATILRKRQYVQSIQIYS